MRIWQMSPDEAANLVTRYLTNVDVNSRNKFLRLLRGIVRPYEDRLKKVHIAAVYGRKATSACGLARVNSRRGTIIDTSSYTDRVEAVTCLSCCKIIDGNRNLYPETRRRIITEAPRAMQLIIDIYTRQRGY